MSSELRGFGAALFRPAAGDARWPVQADGLTVISARDEQRRPFAGRRSGVDLADSRSSGKTAWSSIDASTFHVHPFFSHRIENVASTEVGRFRTFAATKSAFGL